MPERIERNPHFHQVNQPNPPHAAMDTRTADVHPVDYHDVFIKNMPPLTGTREMVWAWLKCWFVGTDPSTEKLMRNMWDVWGSGTPGRDTPVENLALTGLSIRQLSVSAITLHFILMGMDKKVAAAIAADIQKAKQYEWAQECNLEVDANQGIRDIAAMHEFCGQIQFGIHPRVYLKDHVHERNFQAGETCHKNQQCKEYLELLQVVQDMKVQAIFVRGKPSGDVMKVWKMGLVGAVATGALVLLFGILRARRSGY